ncbi:2-amino-4-hydroxy-6-hydroxymethyldihydropteridine diphosphokinase [Billgrantia kenyensis]|uniref:2-amino-4-hydroxy-6-hydroxymethyldihydropteridine pyrophosphokinase n=1 Tax=Billgrantia kenyensis TaxID=321266 RepID=A0A7V9W3G1_9GAMM|nr:2-amino-4-hydroxy-6-hydroxymethyldihydropteridine diphosphokinase [Halomonas kenyensis]MBA2780363.1 2-amino-4-hydroxy-6-hydroxymethyldihydropteridine diphosphokinase [Halomonas kenyensis]MCG6662107.1 2-amino-4-hydroxy-6-hydroxymethyldihydropteridine diphosphokinase [Halomonas kenyensis]
MTPLVDAFVGLGSNLDNPVAQVRRALEELGKLPLTQRIAASRLYASRPVGPQDQPSFVNAVALLRTRLSPLALLDQLQALEQRHRRVRQRHWGPRTLDLDLLLYGNDVLSLPRLKVPHPEMTNRAFVMIPLAELSPAAWLPDGRSATALAETLAAAGDVKVLPDTPD